jgi:protein-S-isoprenylcysteine O-methyltransferase Ste14
MLNASNIISISWLIFLLYWGINWWRVKPAQETVWKDSSRHRWTILWIVVLLVLLSRFVFHKNLFIFTPYAHNSFLQLCGVALVVVGLVIAIVARRTLADNWSSNIELKKNHELITTGIYKYVRHPIYTGMTFMGIGSALGLQSIYTALFFIAMETFLIFKMKKEEKLLQKHFPKEYSEYMRKTKSLIPFIY